MYPALKRLEKNQLLTVYDMQCLGRNRRYYTLTDKGREALCSYIEEWDSFKNKLEAILGKDK